LTNQVYMPGIFVLKLLCTKNQMVKEGFSTEDVFAYTVRCTGTSLWLCIWGLGKSYP